MKNFHCRPAQTYQRLQAAWPVIFCAAVIAFLSQSAMATTPTRDVAEPFDYTAGTTLDGSGTILDSAGVARSWALGGTASGASGHITNVLANMTYPGLVDSGATAGVNSNCAVYSPMNNGGADDLAGLELNAGDISTPNPLWISFLLDVTQQPTAGSSNTIAVISKTTYTTWSGGDPSIVVKPSGSGYVLGVVVNSAGTETVFDSTTRNLGTTNLIVLCLTNTGVSPTGYTLYVWVNPAASTFGGGNPALSSATFASLNNSSQTYEWHGFLLLNQAASGAGAYYFDALRFSSFTGSYASVTPAAPVNYGLSTVSPSSATVLANGTSTATITVALTNNTLGPVSGKTVTLTSSRGATDTISAASGASDSSGHVTFTVKSSTVGTSSYTATDTTDSITIGQTATVTFNNAPSVTTSAANPTNTTSATLNGAISSNGGSSLTSYGFYWSATSPVSTGSTQIQVGTSDLGSYPGNISTSLGSLSVNSNYFYRAYANNAVGNTLGSADVSFCTLPNTPTSPTLGSPTSSTIPVTLGTGDGNPAWTLYAIGEATTGKFVNHATGALQASADFQTAAMWGTVTVTGLGGNTTYTFKVEAENGAGVTTAFSSTASATTSGGTPAVTTQAANGQTATSTMLNGTILSNGGSPVNDYGFFWSASPGVSTSSTKLQAGTDNHSGAYSASLGSLSANTVYYYRAYASNTVPAGILDTADVSFYTLANTPNAPTVSAATANTLNVAITSGDGNPASTAYSIYETTTAKYVTASGLLNSSTPVYQTKAAWGTVTVTNLTSCAGYVFEAVATNGAGVQTAFSSPAVAAYITAPVTPTAAAASGIGAGAFTANWTAVAGATSYYLDVAYDSGFAVFVNGYKNLNVGNATSATVTTSNEGTFYYRVRAANCAGTSASSPLIAASGVTGTSTATLPFYDGFNYPSATNTQSLATASTPVWINGNGTSSAIIKYSTNTLVSPAGLAPASGGSINCQSASPNRRSEGVRYTTQIAADNATVYYSFLYQLTTAPGATLAATNSCGVSAQTIASLSTVAPPSSTNVPNGTPCTILVNTNRQVGINLGGGSTQSGNSQYGGAQLTVGGACLIVVRYTFHPAGNDTADLWVGPASSNFGVAESSVPAPDVTVTDSGTNYPGLSYFTLYNDPLISGNFYDAWDEVRIATNWAGVTPAAPQIVTTFSGLTASPSISYGTPGASITLGGKVSGSGPVYPPIGDIVTATINGITGYGTVTDSSGDFSITYNDSSLTTDGVSGSPYTITYQYAGNPDLNYSASPVDGSTALTVSQASSTVAVTSSKNPSGYRDSIHFTATLPTHATGTVQFLTNALLFDTETLSGGNATSLSTTNLPRGTDTITVQYAGDVNYIGNTNSIVQTVTNHPPIALTMSAYRTAGTTLRITLSDIATNWSDVDRDTVELTGVNLTTTNNQTLWLLNVSSNVDNTFVISTSSFVGYTNGPNVADQFSYSIADGYGGTNIGLVNILIVTNVTGTNSITMINSGTPTTVTAYGLPGYSYVLQRATTLTSPTWVPVSTNTAATNGVISATDNFSDLGGNPPPTAYYRLSWQQQ
jgi:hypothetical protein